MQRLVQLASRRMVRLPAAGIMAVAAGLFALSGCSSVPDYANPVEWYHGAVDMFDDDVPPPPQAADVPGALDPFPSVGDVPEASAREVELSSLESLSEGLAADRANAQYTDEILRSGGDAELLLPTYEVAAQPALEPYLQQPVATQQYSALQMAPGGEVDVKSLFTSLFASSGPRAVAPGATGLLGAGAPATVAATGVLPSTASLTTAGAAFGSSQAAVIYFALGSAALTKESRAALHRVADAYNQRGGTIRVVGHASNRTRELSSERHELINFDVSFKRARAVADELISHGVPAQNVVVIAKSDSEPVYHEWMPSGEAGNRRAEIYFDF